MERFAVYSINPEGAEKYLSLLGRSEEGFPGEGKKALLIPENKGVVIKECFLSESPQRILIKGAAKRQIRPGSNLLPYNSLLTMQNRFWICPETPLRNGKYLLSMPDLTDQDFQVTLKRKGTAYCLSSGSAIPVSPGVFVFLKQEEGDINRGRIFFGDPFLPEQRTKLERSPAALPASFSLDRLRREAYEILGYGCQEYLPYKEGDLIVEGNIVISSWFLRAFERELLAITGKTEGESKAELLRKLPLPLFLWDYLIEDYCRRGRVIKSGNRVLRSWDNSNPGISPVSKAVLEALHKAGMEGSHINAFRGNLLKKEVDGLLGRGQIISPGNGFIYTRDSYKRLVKALFMDKSPGDRLSPGDLSLKLSVSKTRISTLFHHLLEKGFLENKFGNWYIKGKPDD